MAEVKKNFSSNTPRGVAMYLLEVTRLTVDSCMPMASATVFRFSGRRCSTPKARKASCWRTISRRHLEDGLGPLVEALHQPVGLGQRSRRRRSSPGPARAAARPGRGSAGRPAGAAGCRSSARPASRPPDPRARRRRAPPVWAGSPPKAAPGRGVSACSSAIISRRSSSSTPQACFSAAMSRRASSSRLSSSAAMAGSKRLRSFSCSIRHSRTSRAMTPVGSKPWQTASTASTRVHARSPAGRRPRPGRRAGSRPRRPRRSGPGRWRGRRRLKPGHGGLVVQVLGQGLLARSGRSSSPRRRGRSRRPCRRATSRTGRARRPASAGAVAGALARGGSP